LTKSSGAAGKKGRFLPSIPAQAPKLPGKIDLRTIIGLGSCFQSAHLRLNRNIDFAEKHMKYNRISIFINLINGLFSVNHQFPESFSTVVDICSGTPGLCSTDGF